MFGVTKEDIINTLKALRKKTCVYTSENFCDCKFGYDNTQNHVASEQNGCPELRTTIGVLERMTEDEWQDITARTIDNRFKGRSYNVVIELGQIYQAMTNYKQNGCTVMNYNLSVSDSEMDEIIKFLENDGYKVELSATKHSITVRLDKE
tara:strand:+ start:8339 stop:8788 length:450 start_codon:yes stop_codon:yes gene_type:complete